MYLGRLSNQQRYEKSIRGRIAVCGNMECEWTGPLSSCLIHPDDDIPKHKPWPQVGCPACGLPVKEIKRREKDDI